MRRLALWAGLGLVLVAATALVVVLRAPLIEAAGEAYLARQGFPEARLTVTHVGLDGATVESLSLGPGAPSARRIAVGYRPAELRERRLRRLRIEGLEVEIDVARPAPLQRLRALLGDGESDDGRGAAAAGAGPKITLVDARLSLHRAGADAVAVALDGWVDLGRWPVAAEVAGQATAEHTSARFEARVSEGTEGPELRLDAAGESDLARFPWPVAIGPRPEGGHAVFSFTGALPFAWRGEADPGRLLKAAGTLRFDLNIEDLSLPPYAYEVDAEMRLEAATGGGELRLVLAAPATLAAGRVRGEAFRKAGLALPPFTQRPSLSVRMTLAGPEARAPLLVWSPTADGGLAALDLALGVQLEKAALDLRLTGEAEHDAGYGIRRLTLSRLDVDGRDLPLGPERLERLSWRAAGEATPVGFELRGPLLARLTRVAAGDLSVGGVSFEGPVKIVGRSDALVAETLAAGKLAIHTPPPLGALAIAGPLAVNVKHARLGYAGGAMELEAEVDPGTLAGTLDREDGPDLSLSATTGALALSLRRAPDVAGELRVRDASVRVPDADLVVGGLSVTAPFATPATVKPLRLSALLESTATPAVIAPVRIDLEAAVEGRALSATGSLELVGGGASVPFSGGYDIERRRGELVLGPSTLLFSEDLLQPADLSPRLSELQNVTGSLRAEGRMTLGPAAGPRGTATVVLDGLSFDTPAARVEGLAGTVTFDRLLPLTAAPGQELTARRVVAPAPVEDLRLRFGVDASGGGGLRLLLEHAQGRLAEGILAVDDTVLYPAADANTLRLKVERVSLARLFDEWATESLSGSGHLSGVIPLRIGAGGVSIQNGRLRAQEKGVLRLALGDNKELLERQGEHVALMVRALENFHYELLELGLDRPENGQLTLAVSIEGKNPDVLEGYPFRFNISISGDLEPVLAAIREGRALTTDLLRGAVEGVK